MRRRASVWLVFGTLLVVYLLAGAWTTRRVTPTGDEPYYLLAADALLHGEGFELTRRWYLLPGVDYAPGDFLPAEDFYPQTVPSLVGGGRYPLHDLGLSLLIAPLYAAGGLTLVRGAIALGMAAAVALGARLALALGCRPAAAVGAALAVGLSAPALTYSGQVFADAVAPLPIALALGALVGALPRWTLGLAVAALPFLHLRYWPLAVAFVVARVLLDRPRTRGTWVVLVGPTIAVVLVLSAIDLATYGVPLPHAGFLLFFTARSDVSLATYTRPTPEGLAGLFIDRAFGLLPAAPLLALLFVGVGRARRIPRGPLLVALPLPYLALAAVLDWTGGYSPQARYLAPLVPLFVPLLALALSTRLTAVAAAPLACWTAAQSLLYVAAPAFRYDAYGQAPLTDRFWERYAGFEPSAVFPLFGSGDVTPILAGLWLLALAGLVLAGARHRSVIVPAENPSG